MCKSKEEGGERCAYGIRQAKLRNASARLKTVLKQIESGDLSPEERIKAIAKRDAILTEQYELYAEEGETSLPEGWDRHLTEEIADDLAQVKFLAESKDLAGLEVFVNERVNSEEYVNALATRDALYLQAIERKEEFKEVVGEYNENGGSFEPARQLALKTLESNEFLALVKNELDEYRAVTAQAVSEITALREEEGREDGTFVEYTADTLNNLEAIGEFPSGSREWLESRQGGIGGSDVGSIIGADPAWATKNFQEVLASKVDPITDEQVNSQGNNQEEFNNAPGRGNAWEEEVLHTFAQNNPDLTIAHCKTSWRNKELPFQYANFDGLLLDKDGNPDGIVEIKTGSTVEKWGQPEDGLYGVPAGYRAQVLWYMQAAGFERGALAVMLNDNEYREYHFTLNDSLREEQQQNLVAAQAFWDNVKKRRANPELFSTPKRTAGFTATSLAPGYKNKESVFRDLAAYREESEESIRTRFDSLLGSAKDLRDPEKVAGVLRQMYTEYDPSTRSKPVVGIDLETNSTSPLKGRIIEVGLTTRAADGSEVKKIQQLHGLSDRARRGNGAGATEVHNINLSDILGKPRFESERNQKRLLAELKNSGFVLAHNASYEDRWLRVHLKGYAEARDAGEIRLLDTMVLSRNLLPNAKNHRLQSFVEHNGGVYSGAHRAYRDAEIMTDAFFNFQNELHTKK